jgi:glycosyltransferase involved in cell wall biosynthesis
VNTNKRKILFFSSVKNINTFNTTSFYDLDIKALAQSGHSVIVTNKISSFFKFWKYDIAFLYFYKKSIFPASIAKLFLKKIYFTGGIDELSLYVSKSTFQLISQQVLFKMCYILSDKCNIVSSSDLVNTIDVLNFFPKVNSKKLSFWPHGIQVEDLEFDSKIKNNLFLTTICWMGSVGNVKRKGLDRCLYFLKSVIVHENDAKLIIIGALGEGSIFLNNIITELNLENHVIFTGEIANNEKVNYLIKSKYFLQLSRYEGFGMAVIEAMLYHCRIIHSNIGGLKDTIGENGLIFSNFDDYNRLAFEFVEYNKISDSSESILIENHRTVVNKFSITSRAEYFKNNLVV